MVFGLLGRVPIAVDASGTMGSSARSVVPSDAAQGAQSGWTQDHFDSAHSGSSPYENILNVANVSGLVPKWTTGEPIRVQGTVVVAHRVVYVGGQDSSEPTLGHVFALDAETGEELWEATQPGGGALTGIGVCCGMVFAGTIFEHKLHAYDALTGEERWALQATGAVSAVTVVGQRLFVQTNSYQVYALDSLTGAILWQKRVPYAASTAHPAVASGSVFVAADNKVRALRARDGSLRWKVNLPAVAFSSPTVVNGVVYEGVVEAGVYALSAKTGAVLWHQPVGGGTETTPSVDAHSVYVGDGDGNLYAFDRATGTPRWTTSLGWRFVLNDPIEANGVVYAATIGLFALDPQTGQELWSAPTDIVNTDPPVVDGVLYVGDFAGNVMAYALPGS